MASGSIEPPEFPEDFRDFDVDGLQDWVDAQTMRLADDRRELARRIAEADEEDAHELIEIAGWFGEVQAGLRNVNARLARLAAALEREARNAAGP